MRGVGLILTLLATLGPFAALGAYVLWCRRQVQQLRQLARRGW